MPPNDFASLANSAFDTIKNIVGNGEALYLPKSGGQFSVKGPFDDRAREVDPDTNQLISSNVFTFGLHLSDIPVSPSKGDKLIIDGTAYQVIKSEEDGVPGVSTVLILHKVAS